MEVPEAIKVAVQGIEMAVEHIAGATAAGMVIGCAEPVGVAAELVNGVQGSLAQLLVVLLGPQLQDGDPWLAKDR